MSNTDDIWDSTVAEQYLKDEAKEMREVGEALIAESKYLLGNASGYASSEEEFRLGLDQGLGWDDESIEKAVKKVTSNQK